MVDYYERLSLAIDYIERNLRAPIQVADVRAAAFGSQWHFQRVFRFITGHSVAGYLRGRRLAEAGHRLLDPGARVTDVALDFGYESPEAFSRAFRRAFGLSPAHWREGARTSSAPGNPTGQLEFLERIDIDDGSYRDVYPDVSVSERVVIRQATRVAGLRRRTSMRDSQQFRDIPALWGTYFAGNTTQRLADQGAKLSAPATTIGVYSNWDFAENFDLTIGTPIDPASAQGLANEGSTASEVHEDPAALRHIELPAGKYVVFTIQGYRPEELVAGWKYIYGTWMPNTRSQRAWGVDFDLFDERFTQDESALSEIYIPIV